MSEKILRIPVSELTTVRVVCKYKPDSGKECGGVVEVPIELLTRVRACPICRNELVNIHNDQPYHFLAMAIEQLQRQTAASVEFVLPAKD